VHKSRNIFWDGDRCIRFTGILVALVPEANRGSAYGLFNASIGVMALPASVIAGYLWNISTAAPFAFGALMAFLAFLALLFLPKRKEI
jgi:MFS family permease